MPSFDPMQQPKPGASLDEWQAYARDLERRVEAASSYIDRIPENWRELQRRVSELEAAIREHRGDENHYVTANDERLYAVLKGNQAE